MRYFILLFVTEYVVSFRLKKIQQKKKIIREKAEKEKKARGEQG